MADYHLIAAFDSPAHAKAMKRELVRFFTAHAAEHDALVEETDDDAPGPTEAARRLGKKYGHTWKKSLSWGDEGLTHANPEVVVVGDSLVLYQGYGPGFGPDLPKILTRAGATLQGKEKVGVPVVHVEFDVAKNAKGHAFGDELERFFVQRLETNYIGQWQPYPLAWGQGEGRSDQVAWVLRDGHVAFTYPIHPAYIDRLRAHLRSHRARKLEMTMASSADVRKLRKADATARKATARARKAAAAGSRLDLAGKSVMLTGTFRSGTMNQVKAQVVSSGARVAKSMTRHLNLLIVGDTDSPLYGLASPTEKLRKAEAHNARGAAIEIVAEAALPRPTPRASISRSKRPKPRSNARAPSAAAAQAAAPRAKPKAELVHQGEADYLYQLAVSGDRLLVAGMHGTRRIYASTDGRRFQTLELPDGPGLRCIAAAGKWVWACGNRQALVSSDHGETFKSVSAPPAHAVAVDEKGRAMLGHSRGACLRQGKRWSPVKAVPGAIWGIARTPGGMVLACHNGQLFRYGRRGLETLEVKAEGSLFAVASMPSGTLIAVGGDGRVVRSDDGCESFVDYRLKGAKDLHAVATMDDGRIVAAGGGGRIWCSFDGGSSFHRVASKARQRTFWGAAGFRRAVYLAGMHEGIVRVGN